MNKIPCACQNMEAKTLPADVCIFDFFGRLSPAAIHSADCRFDPGVKWWIHVYTHIYTKAPFCCVETVTNNALNRRHVFDRLWANAAPTMNTAFSLTNVHAKWWIHHLLKPLTPLLSYTTSIYDWPIWVSEVFCFPGQLLNLDDLSIQFHLCLYEHI